MVNTFIKLMPEVRLYMSTYELSPEAMVMFKSKYVAKWANALYQTNSGPNGSYHMIKILISNHTKHAEDIVLFA